MLRRGTLSRWGVLTQFVHTSQVLEDPSPNDSVDVEIKIDEE